MGEMLLVSSICISMTLLGLGLGFVLIKVAN